MDLVGKIGTKQEFDAKSSTYDTNHLSGWYKAHNDIIADELGANNVRLLLDIGCATGYLLKKILSCNKNANAIGVDLSPSMVHTAELGSGKDILNRCEFHCDDWEGPGEKLLQRLKRRDVSHAVCASTFHYFQDPRTSLIRIYEALEPGGCFYLLERRKEKSPATQLWDVAHRYIIRDNVRFYSSNEMLSMLRQAGFQEQEVVKTIKKLFWQNKLTTNLTLIKAVK